MSRIEIPASVEASPAASQPLLQSVQQQLGSVPNLFRMVGTSPAALAGYLGLNSALAKGALDVRTRERLALTVAAANGCDYCLAAHSYLGKNLAKLDEGELAANREARSSDAKADAALKFAAKLVRARGHVSAEDVRAVQAAGYSDAQLMEIIVHVALNTLTNYVNSALETELDFPRVDSQTA